ncbi:hypothetical protein DSO57_1024038 [Entomophthora muscae]|uniref:Uncharacterized protein n=1 Tax=Entomophthora muscae TaxID=34485 RepID=A0ACC2UMK1_9FUNG|nr:hypothetical protein DSO57_1024038 [Entomophthora muscae]
MDPLCTAVAVALRIKEQRDRRGEFNSDAALTQSVQGAQAARGRSINPRDQKLTRKYTKVVTTKTVNDVTTKRVSLVYNPVYCHNGVLAAILEKVKPVFDTSYKPYVSDSEGADKDKLPQYFQIKKGGSQVPMPCVVPNTNDLTPTAKKAKYHIIPDATCNTVRIDNLLPLKTWAQGQDSNPEPKFLQAAGPMDQEPACPPAFF